MTSYLVDTNVLSAAAPTLAVQHGDVVAWMDARSAHLFVSAVTIAEIADGIAKAKREGARRKATSLAEWLRAVLHLYGDRVLPFDVAAAEIAGTMADLARGRGFMPGFADIAIAATARLHGLTILSRNVRDFACMDAAVVDPFEGLPDA